MRPSSSTRHSSLLCSAGTTNRLHAVVINAVGSTGYASMVPVQPGEADLGSSEVFAMEIVLGRGTVKTSI